MAEVDLESWTCPLPLRDYPGIVMGHGGGGKLTEELIENLFLPAFGGGDGADAAVVQAGRQLLTFSTDSFVVDPLFFPGGNIGDLAVNGTVNDLAMRGGQPLFLSAAFILEEGFSTEQLGRIAATMGEAAAAAGVRLVTGDTKVVERGHGHGLFITTSGLGLLPDNLEPPGPERAQPGDAIIVSGPLGNHGMAIMSLRQGLEFETTIESDTAPLNGLVSTLMDGPEAVHVLRDPTRGGVASALNEIAARSRVGMLLDESTIPVDLPVASACEMLGLDPLFVANEGKLLALVPGTQAGAVLERMRSHPLGRQAVVIGEVTEANPGLVAVRTALGGTRVVDTQVGEQLPRIC